MMAAQCYRYIPVECCLLNMPDAPLAEVLEFVWFVFLILWIILEFWQYCRCTLVLAAEEIILEPVIAKELTLV